MDKRWMIIWLEDQQKVKLTSLLGECFEAELKETYHQLVVGEVRESPIESNDQVTSCQCIRIRRIDPHAERGQLEALLRETALFIAARCHRVPVGCIETMWAELDKTDQLDIGATQWLLLDHADALLRQLSLQHDEDLAPILKDLDEARQLKAQEDTYKRSLNAQAHEKAARERLHLFHGFFLRIFSPR
jgi:hypothetical protein